MEEKSPSRSPRKRGNAYCIVNAGQARSVADHSRVPQAPQHHNNTVRWIPCLSFIETQPCLFHRCSPCAQLVLPPSSNKPRGKWAPCKLHVSVRYAYTSSKGVVRLGRHQTSCSWVHFNEDNATIKSQRRRGWCACIEIYGIGFI